MLHPIANFANLGDENAFAVLARANQLASEGRDIINLGIGQPDFKTPDHIVKAAIAALEAGEHGYTAANGITALRETVAEELKARHGADIAADRIMIMPGGKVTMYMAIGMFGEPGADILYPDPGFPIYRSMIEFTGARPIPVPIARGKWICLFRHRVALADHACHPAHHPQQPLQPHRRRHTQARNRQAGQGPCCLPRCGDPVR